MKKALVIALAASAASIGGIATAVAQSASTFQQTCTNVRYVEEGGNAMIAADCKRQNGSVNQSTVVIKGIDNTEGKLTHTAGNNPSTFQRSCNDMRVEMGGPSGVMLAGSCRTSQGTHMDTTTQVWDLENIDGNLQYPY